jgi:uncharacterized protein
MNLRIFIAVLILCSGNVFAQNANNPSGPSSPPASTNPASQFITLSTPANPNAGQNQDKSGVTPSITPASPDSAPKASQQSNTKSVPTEDASADNKNKNPYIDDKLVVVGTGAITGIYYPAGGIICRLVNKERKNLSIRCAVESTPGSIYNLSALQNAEVDLAIIQSDWEEHAYNGTGYFAKIGKIDKLRHIFSLHNEAFTLIVQKKSDIKKFDDIKNHVVNIGPEGSGGRATMEDVMKAKGWGKQDFKSLAEYKQSDQAKVLCDGKVDAVIVASGHPSGAVQEISSLCETRIIDINDEVIQKFILGNPKLAPTIIPGGMYPGNPNDTSTFGAKANLVTTTDVSDDIAYNITKTVLENLDAFKSLHPVFQHLDRTKMLKEGRTAPFHDGALKYYREKGLIQ